MFARLLKAGAFKFLKSLVLIQIFFLFSNFAASYLDIVNNSVV